MRRILGALSDQFIWMALLRAVMAVSPIVLAAYVSGDVIWLLAGIVGISTHIAAEKADLAPAGVLLHGAAIALGLSALFYSLLVPPLFVLACGMFGATTMWLTKHGEKLRKIGNFTFIPSLYLACELSDGLPPSQYHSQLAGFLPYLALSVVPPLILDGIQTWRDKASFRGIFRSADHGPANETYVEPMIAIALGVSVAAACVEIGRLHFGQWVVWSAASVVTGQIASAQVKVRQRFLGALIGVPLGILVGFVVPHNTFSYGMATLGVMLTLVTFRHYIVAFTTRCMFVALALVLAGGTTMAATHRIFNVMLGSFVGILSVLIVHAIFSRVSGKYKRETETFS